MVTYSITKIIPTCSPIIGQCFDTMIVAPTDKEWLFLRLGKCWKLFWATSRWFLGGRVVTRTYLMQLKDFIVEHLESFLTYQETCLQKRCWHTIGGLPFSYIKARNYGLPELLSNNIYIERRNEYQGSKLDSWRIRWLTEAPFYGIPSVSMRTEFRIWAIKTWV